VCLCRAVSRRITIEYRSLKCRMRTSQWQLRRLLKVAARDVKHISWASYHWLIDMQSILWIEPIDIKAVTKSSVRHYRVVRFNIMYILLHHCSSVLSIVESLITKQGLFVTVDNDTLDVNVTSCKYRLVILYGERAEEGRIFFWWQSFDWGYSDDWRHSVNNHMAAVLDVPN